MSYTSVGAEIIAYWQLQEIFALDSVYGRRARFTRACEGQYPLAIICSANEFPVSKGVLEASMQSELLTELAAEAEQSQQTTPDNLSRLRQLAGEVAKLDRQILELEGQLSAAKGQRNRILSRDMIDLMDECGVDSVVANGYSYAAGEYCKASIGTQHPNPAAAYAYLEDEGAGDLLNRSVEVRFPRGFEEEVEALTRYAREHYQMADVAVSKGVPWARLTAWVKEQRRAGRELPLELLGATVGRVVKVKTSEE